MDGHRFDSIARAVANRRSALRATGAGFAALLGGVAGLRSTAASEATPVAESEHPAFLFVQTATGGSFSPNPQGGTPAVEGTPTPGGGAEYLLTLDGHHGGTIYFSDRPDRIFGDTPTQQFLDGLGFSPVNPPNAALVTQADGEEEVIILELVEPTYDEAGGTVTYGANILGEFAGESLTAVEPDGDAATVPEAFGRASLFIDECQAISNCFLLMGPHSWFIRPIPGGPYQACWDPASGTCTPCDESREDLVALCGATYPECGDLCLPVP